MRQWRLIITPPFSGATNMSIDEAILEKVSEKSELPTLRLYGWQPFCLSLGYGQHIRDAHLDNIVTQGWEIVRRPTGGKAILHGDEITYSLCLPIDHDLAQGDVVTSYRRISEALMQSLMLLGLSPQSEEQAKGNKGLGAVCFEVPSHYEITVEGRKLIGSAQLRRKLGILQHGTLPLWGDIARICDALAYEDETTRQLSKQHVRERATTLERVLGKSLSYETVAEAFMQGFSDTFEIEWITSDLSLSETNRAEELFTQIYTHPEWTHKR
jgi:lipoyl(octanoyl) transferase